MSRLRESGLGARLALALAGVAVVSVALATLLANAGLDSRLRAAARERLDESGRHSAELAAEVYARDGGWTRAGLNELDHLARMNGYRLGLADRTGRRLLTGIAAGDHTRATVRVGAATVGSVEVTPAGGTAVTDQDRHLHSQLDRLHLLAALLALCIAVAAAALLAPRLARPLRRVTEVARRMERGELDRRVAAGGGREIQQVGHALNRLAETLEREEQIRREAAADVAHELRTPLGGIVSRVEAAQDGVLESDRALEAIHTDALRLTRLIEDLGRLADAQRPGLLIDKQPVDLAEIARRQADHYADFFTSKDIAFERQLQPTPVRGDEGRLDQVVDNLLSNALRYTDPGGRVTLGVRPLDGHVELEVSDSGIGIRAEDLPHLFERFWRGDRSRSRETGGAGIGLAIVSELVRAHDGRIEVESKAGQGSTFRMRLPGKDGRRQ